MTTIKSLTKTLATVEIWKLLAAIVQFGQLTNYYNRMAALWPAPLEGYGNVCACAGLENQETKYLPSQNQSGQGFHD